VELAVFELAFLKIFDGPGIEDSFVPNASHVLALDDESLMNARPVPAVSLRLFAFSHPIHTYMLAARNGGNPDLPERSPTFVALSRVNYRVLPHALSAAQYEFLNAFDGSRSIGECLGIAKAGPAGAQTVRAWLCDWADKGFFESFAGHS
jgi:hypothetical protein